MRENRLFPLCCLVVVVVLSFLVCLWHNVRVLENKPLLIFDSSHYLLTAAHFHKALLSIGCGKLHEAFLCLINPQAVADIFIDGPVIPLAAAFAFVVSGKEPVANNWTSLAALLAFLNAATACAVSYITFRLIGRWRLALFAGLVFGLSPSAILGGNRFLTEPFAAFFLALEIALTAYLINFPPPRAAFCSRLLMGLTAGLGFYLKPALAFAWLLPPVFDVFYCLSHRRWSREINSVVAMLCGFGLVVFAWLGFSLAGTGKLNIMPERVPAHNLAKGNDLEADGWASYPGVAGTCKLQTLEKPVKILAAAWSENPGGLFSLYLRKIPRLIFLPWNDFNQKPYGLPVFFQSWLYHLILLTALTGMVHILLADKGSLNWRQPGQKVLQWLLLLTVAAAGLIYLPFEAISRYGYPVYPLLFPAAAIALDRLSAHGKEKAKLFWLAISITVIACFNIDWKNVLPVTWSIETLRQVHLSLYVGLGMLYLLALWFWMRPRIRGGNCFAVSLVCFIVLAPAIACANFSLDYQSLLFPLAKGSKVTKSVTLSSHRDSAAKYLVLCDFTAGSSPSVVVNGKSLPVNRWHSMTSLNKDKYYIFNMRRMFAEAFDVSLEAFRDWRVFPIAAELLKDGRNTLELQAEAPMRVVFDRLHSGSRKVALPGWYCFSCGRLCNFPEELDGRLLNLNEAAIESHLDASGKVYPHLVPRFYLLEVKENERTASLKPETIANQKRELISISPRQFDPLLQEPSEAAIIIDKVRLKAARTTAISIPVPESLRTAKYYEVTLKGQIKSLGKAGKGSIFVSAESMNPSFHVILPNTPSFLPATTNWSKFSFTTTLNCGGFPNSPRQLSLAVFPGRWSQITQYGLDYSSSAIKFKDLQIELNELNLPELAESRITIH